jgi:hypothetical protein
MRLKFSLIALVFIAISLDAPEAAMQSCGGASPNRTAGTFAELSNCASVYTEGDTITITNGATINVTSGLSFANGGVTIRAASACGATISHNAGNNIHAFNLSRDLTHDTIVENLEFTEGANHGTGESSYIRISGPAPPATNYNPVIVQNNCFEHIDGSMHSAMRVAVVGGAIISGNTFDASITPYSGLGSCNGGRCDQAINVTAAETDPNNDASWTLANTIGTNDNDGLQNVYIEGNTFIQFFNQAFDTSSNTRVVFRYNVMNESAGAAHGADSSPSGMRHVEYYNNTFLHDYKNDNGTGCTQSFPVSRALNARGGTVVVTDNDLSGVENDGCWNSLANNLQIEIQNLRRSAAVYPCWGAASYAGANTTYINQGYPAYHQVGRGTYNGSNPLTSTGESDPMYIWNNTNLDVGASNFSPNDCGASADDISDYVQLGRDYFLSARPSYTKYTYPHPLLGESEPDPEPSTGGRTGRRLRRGQ